MLHALFHSIIKNFQESWKYTVPELFIGFVLYGDTFSGLLMRVSIPFLLVIFIKSFGLFLLFLGFSRLSAKIVLPLALILLFLGAWRILLITLFPELLLILLAILFRNQLQIAFIKWIYDYMSKWWSFVSWQFQFYREIEQKRLERVRRKNRDKQNERHNQQENNDKQSKPNDHYNDYQPSDQERIEQEQEKINKNIERIKREQEAERNTSPYKILEVSENSTKSEIIKSYKKHRRSALYEIQMLKNKGLSEGDEKIIALNSTLSTYNEAFATIIRNYKGA